MTRTSVTGWRRYAAGAALAVTGLLAGGVMGTTLTASAADYPGATVQRVETDSDGVYEAHIATADGRRLVVQLDGSFAVTGTQTHGRR